jgi:SHS2 domain-containing protein
MLDENSFGYEEIEHTADWELRVWAPDLPRLLEQAARGMYALSHTRLMRGDRVAYDLEFPFEDRESLLVDFLSELLFYGEDKGIAFDQFDLTFDETNFKACLSGAAIDRQSKEIKAVTYHRMKVRETGGGLEVNIVFDV